MDSDILSFSFAALAVWVRMALDVVEKAGVMVPEDLTVGRNLHAQLMLSLDEYNKSRQNDVLKISERHARELMLFWKRNARLLPGDYYLEFTRLDSIMRSFDAI